MILKMCNFKKNRIGSKVKKLCKQLRHQIVWKQVEDTTQGLLYRMEINSKVFAIPILTASGL